MNAPSIDIKDLLEAGGHGTFGASSGWAISVGVEPDEPDTSITIYDSPGEPANPKFLLDHPRFEVRVRAEPNDYLAGYSKAQDVKDALLGLPPQVLGGTQYDGIWSVVDVFYLGPDKKHRPVFVSSWRVTREPSSGDHRVSL